MHVTLRLFNVKCVQYYDNLSQNARDFTIYHKMRVILLLFNVKCEQFYDY